MNNTTTQGKIDAISFFKGIAIIMILLCHATQKFEIPVAMHYVPKFCQMGCQIFFAISAFCLCLSMERGHGIKIFYKRRLLSIAPGYWLTVGLYVLFALLTESWDEGGGNFLHINTEPLNIGANIGMVHGLIPTEANNKVVKGGWYVGTLVLLYLFFPLLRNIYMRYFKGKRGLFFVFLVQILSFIILVLLNWIIPSLSLKNDKFLYFSFVNQLPCFCLGIYLYDLYKSGRLFDVRSPFFKCVTYTLLAFALFFSYKKYAYVFEPGIFTFAFIFLFIFVVKIKMKLNSRIAIVLRRLGDNSYPIYLLHPLVLYTGTYLLNTYYHTNIIVYCIWLPISFLLVVYLSKLYNTMLLMFKSLIKIIAVR